MNRDIIVIGASAGGIAALKELVSGFPADLPASVFVTLHLPSRSETVLPKLLSASGPLPASHPREGEPILRQHIYVAPPDYHLRFADEHIHLSRGPKENMQRPCINVMFRSAAEVFGPRVAGVVLSGLLDDGAAGLWEIQQRGGLALVQDPSEAAYRSMPESAIRGIEVDKILSLKEMTKYLVTLTQGSDKGGERRVRGNEKLEPSTQACPLCGGVMERATLAHLHEYRCHTGHRFGMKVLLEEKTAALERAMYSALAQSEELLLLLEEEKGGVAGPVPDTQETEIAIRRKETAALRELVHRQKSTPV